MKKLRVLVLMHHYLVPPDDAASQDAAAAQWRTEHDVLQTLRDLRTAGAEAADEFQDAQRVRHHARTASCSCHNPSIASRKASVLLKVARRRNASRSGMPGSARTDAGSEST